MESWDYFEYFFKFILNQKETTDNLKRQDFIQFYEKVMSSFYGGTKDITAIPEISELFDKTSIAERGRLDSESFRQALKFIRTKLNVTELHYSTLMPILRAAENFNQRKWDDLLKRLNKQGVSVTANDLILLKEVIDNPALYQRLFNRTKLISDARKILGKAAFQRKSIDQVSKLQAELKMMRTMFPDKKEIIKQKEEEIERLQKAYSERPAVISLSNLELLRINLLYEALEREDFLR